MEYMQINIWENYIQDSRNKDIFFSTSQTPNPARLEDVLVARSASCQRAEVIESSAACQRVSTNDHDLTGGDDVIDPILRSARDGGWSTLIMPSHRAQWRLHVVFSLACRPACAYV